jgi:Tol biopolymer transport system component
MINNSSFPELIPREVLFASPLKTNPQISPDGNMLSYIAPLDNSPNIWVETIGKEDDRAVTEDKPGKIIYYRWRNSKEIIYFRDKDGNELWHLYKVNIDTGEVKCLTPYKNVSVKPLAFDKNFPNHVIFAMNKETEENDDLYYLDLISNKLEMIDKNTGNITSWMVDNEFKLRGKVLQNNDATFTLMIRKDNHSPWRNIITADEEDNRLLRIRTFMGNGNHIYLMSAINSDTMCVFGINAETGEIKIIAAEIMKVTGSQVKNYIFRGKNQLLQMTEQYNLNI